MHCPHCNLLQFQQYCLGLAVSLSLSFLACGCTMFPATALRNIAASKSLEACHHGTFLTNHGSGGGGFDATCKLSMKTARLHCAWRL
jgi:hypothetical protein